MTKEVAEEVEHRLSKNSMLKSLYDLDYSDYRERIESRAAEAVDKRQGRDNHYGNHDPELSPDCQSEDQGTWTTRSASINKLADKDFFARGINKLRARAAWEKAQGLHAWEDSGQ